MSIHPAWNFENLANMSPMTATGMAPTIRREMGDGICVLTFDRPESGANIFDVTTMQDLSGHLDAMEKRFIASAE